MNYKIAVISVNFDKNYDNVIRFNSKTERNAYFNIPAIFEDVPVCNFNASSLLRTSVTARFDAATDLTQLLMSNYCIVQNVEKPEEIYFYFVLSAEQKSGSTIQLQLELDIFQTFYLDVDFSECFINRAHLNRFESGGGENVKFLSGDKEDNMLYQAEDIEDPPTRIVTRDKIKWNIFNENDKANIFISEHIRGWIYVYISPGEDFNISGGEAPKKYGDNLPGMILYTESKAATALVTLADYVSGYVTASRVIVYPIVEKGYGVILNGYSWDLSELQAFVQYASPYIQSIKLSNMPPLFRADPNGKISDITASAGETMLLINVPDYNDLRSDPPVNYVQAIRFYGGNSVSLKLWALPMLPQEGTVNLHPLDDSVPINDNGYFNRNDIVSQQTHNPALNPKMYSEAFRQIQISMPDGKTYNYDQQKLGTLNGEITIRYIENLTCDITRMFAYVENNSDEDDIYTDLMAKAYVGALSSGDFAMPFTSDQLREYLAQNKNFYEQTKYNANMERIKKIVSGFAGIGQSATKGFASGGPIGALFGLATGMQQFTSDLITSGMTYAQTLKNMEYTADNMRSAPDEVKEASGSAIFNLTLRDFTVCIDTFSPLKTDIIRINDMMHRYGYTVQRIGKIKDYDHIRHYFNFVMAEVEEVLSDTVNISLDVRDMFKQAFAHGVRFWNPSATMYDFDPENYEEYLAEYAKEETAA